MTDADSNQGWKAPSTALVDQALSRIGDLQHRRVFYERLNNPLWVDPLDKKEVFNTPPKQESDSNGYLRWIPWPEGEYLSRMAQVAPAKVAKILTRVATGSQNPYIHELVVRAAIGMPSEDAATLVRIIAKFVNESSAGLRDGLEVVSLIESLASGSQYKKATLLAQALLRPRGAEEGAAGIGSRNVEAGIDRHWYDEALTRVVAALQKDPDGRILQMAAVWLELQQKASGNSNSDTGADYSYIWRASISDHSQNHRFEEIGDALTDCVRNIALDQMQSGGTSPTEIIKTLERGGVPLLRRIALCVLSARVAGDEEALILAQGRLLDEELLDTGYRREYSQLASVALPHVHADVWARWADLILGCPPIDESVREFVLSRRLEDESDDEAIQRHQDIWQLTWLSAIGTNSLRSPCKQRLASLVERYGAPEHSQFASWSSSVTRVGSISPVTQEELSERTIPQIVQFLAGWEPDAPGPHGPTREGLGQVLASLVRSRPAVFSRAATDFKQSNPEYVRALLSGLRETLKDNETLDWASVLDLCASFTLVKNDPAHALAGVDGPYDVLGYLQREICNLVEAGASLDTEATIPPALLKTAIEVVAPVLAHSDPTPQRESAEGGSNMDPLTLSLNTTRPSAIRALVRVAAKSFDSHDRGDDEPSEVVLMVSKLLSRRLTPIRDESLAVAAAFGEELGRLIWVAPDWVNSHANLLLSIDSFGDVVLSTTLSIYSTSKRLIDALTSAESQLIARSARGEELTVGWRTDRTPLESLGDHLVLLVIRGEFELNSPLVDQFFTEAPVTARARVLGHLGWTLMHSEDVPQEALVRAQSLWDSREDVVEAGASHVDELAEFFWWVVSEKFGVDWWLPRLGRAVLAPSFDARGLLAEHLETAASKDPASTVKILESLLLAPNQGTLSRYSLVERAPAIIALALESGDLTTVEAGQRLMDSLGRSGHIRISELVQQRRDRQIGFLA